MGMRTLRLAVCLILVAVAAWSTDVSGVWTGEVALADGDTFALTCTFKQDGDKLTGSIDAGQGSTFDVVDGKVNGDKISFSVQVDLHGGTKFLTEGTVKGDEIDLNAKAEGSDQALSPIVLKRRK